jgi:hypothetical protein
MAAIAATDVTYTLVKQRKEESGNKVYNLTISFGDGALTYPSGGVPLTAAKMGCPNSIISCLLNSPDSANGYVYKYDLGNNKLRIYQGDNDQVGDTALVELLTSIAPAAASLSIEVIGF